MNNLNLIQQSREQVFRTAKLLKRAIEHHRALLEANNDSGEPVHSSILDSEPYVDMALQLAAAEAETAGADREPDRLEQRNIQLRVIEP